MDLKTKASLVESAPVIIAFHDTHHCILWANAAYRAATGMSLQEIEGQQCYSVWGLSKTCRGCPVTTAMETGEPAEAELTPQNQDHWPDSQGSWSSKAAPIRDESGTIIGAIEVAYNITDRKRAEEQLHTANQQLKLMNQQLRDVDEQLRALNADLARSNKDLEQFAYSASHDLQEPLRKVIAFGSLLMKDYGDRLEGDAHEYVQHMQDASKRMRTLINDLIAFSRVTTKGKEFAPVDMNEIVQTVLWNLEMRIGETGATVETGDLPTLQADPTQMRQLMQNLIGNALKFHRKGRPPFVRIYSGEVPNGVSDTPTSGPHCRIIVADDGIGFDEKYAERIFGVFQRLHPRGEYGGSGIGLAVCRRIVERHAGTITAQSKPGAGAQFMVTLPLKRAEDERER